MVQHKQRFKFKLVGSKARVTAHMLQVAWRIRPWAIVGFAIGATLETSSFMVSIYATAKLASLLAHYAAFSATGQIWFWLWADIIAAAAMGIGFWLMGTCKQLLYFRTVRWATNRFLATLCQLDMPDFYDEKVRNQINKAQAGYTWQLSNFVQASLDLIYGILRFVVTAAVVTQITWWLIPLIAIFLIPTLIIEGKLAKVQWFVWDSKGDVRHIFWGLEWIIRQSKGQMELRSSQARKYVLDKIDGINRTFYQEQEGKYRGVNRFASPAKLLETVGTAFGSIVLLRQFLASAISLDRYFFLSGALLRIGGSLNNIFGTLARMQEQFLFVENYFELIDRKPRHTDKPNALQLPRSSVPKIAFEHVDFTYPGQTTPVFTDLSFTIAAGQHIAIVGENGAGKSTLIKLLLRFYRPTAGRILVDGQDLQGISIESWYDQLATLFQDFNQYPFSIAENIEIARPEHKGKVARLAKAARASSVDKFVKDYTHGWGTVLDNTFEKGIEPSGGQWQRVALARAFYRQANILILDEPTSAIDAKAEYDIFNSIFDHYQGKSAIIVSHRFSTVRRADTIIVIDHGQIIEQGSHQALMKNRGLYHELFTKQAEGYRD